MDVLTLKNQIKNKNLDSFYIFIGPELTLLNYYIKMMAEFTDSDTVRLEDVKELIKRLGTKSMLKSRHIYVLRDCKDFLSSDELQAKFEHFRASDSVVILVYTAVDKRSKLYKKFQDKFVQFDYMTEDVLVKYVQKEINLSDRNCRLLINICDRDYGRILLEIDKIKKYAEGNITLIKNVENNAFEILLNSGVIHVDPQDRIFDFVDAVLRYKPKKSFEIYEECVDAGENTFVFLVNLYNNAKNVLQYQLCRNRGDLEKITGMSSTQAYHAKNKSGIYSNDDLLYFMELLQKCDIAIKRGTIDESIAIPYVLTMFWS